MPATVQQAIQSSPVSPIKLQNKGPSLAIRPRRVFEFAERTDQ